MKIFAIFILVMVCILSVLTFLKYSSISEDLIDRPNTVNNIPQDITPAGYNFVTEEGVVDLGSGLYSLEEKLLREGKGFSILYSVNNDSYVIAITKLPLNVNRNDAERYFLELLNINESTACSMNVYVGSPVSISESHSSENLGLSFCPGAIKL